MSENNEDKDLMMNKKIMDQKLCITRLKEKSIFTKCFKSKSNNKRNENF